MKNHFKIFIFSLLIISLFTLPSSAQYCVQEKTLGITTALGMQLCKNVALENPHDVYNKAKISPATVCPVPANNRCRAYAGHASCIGGYFQCTKAGDVLVPTAVAIYQERIGFTSEIWVGYACYDPALIGTLYP